MNMVLCRILVVFINGRFVTLTHSFSDVHYEVVDEISSHLAVTRYLPDFNNPSILNLLVIIVKINDPVIS